MRGAANTGIICTDFTLDPDPIKACTWQQAALDAFVSDQAERTQIAAAEAEVSLIAASDSFDPSNREVKPDGCAVKIPSNHRECFVQQNSPMEFGQLYEKKIRKHLLGYKKYHDSKEEGLEFLVAVKCFGYAGGVVSVWVYYAVLDKPDDDD